MPLEGLRRRSTILLDLAVAALSVQLFLDQSLLTFLGRIRHEPIVQLLRGLPGSTDQFGLICAFGLACALMWRATASDCLLPNRFAYVFVTCMASLTIAEVSKIAIGRARPALFLDNGTYGYQLFNGAGFDSLPSSHAAVAFGLAAALGALWPEQGRIVFSIAAAIAISHVVAEYHYASDAIIGCAVGVATAWLTKWTFESCQLRLTEE